MKLILFTAAAVLIGSIANAGTMSCDATYANFPGQPVTERIQDPVQPLLNHLGFSTCPVAIAVIDKSRNESNLLYLARVTEQRCFYGDMSVPRGDARHLYSVECQKP